MKKLFLPAAIACITAMSSCSATQNLNIAQLLSGKSFQVERIRGAALNPDNFMKGAPVFNFGTDGSMTGNTGCNNFMGNFKVDGSKLTLNPGGTTRMACPGTGETDFLGALKEVTGLKKAGNKIKLMNGATELMSLVSKK